MLQKVKYPHLSICKPRLGDTIRFSQARWSDETINVIFPHLSSFGIIGGSSHGDKIVGGSLGLGGELLSRPSRGGPGG